MTAIPEGLPDQFLNWKLGSRKNHDTGQWVETKLPCDAHGEVVDAHDPSQWMTHSQAAASGLGVAFVLTEDDPWFFLDMDKCYDVIGQKWSAEASAIFQSFSGAWGEVSQSGAGLHVMGTCDNAALADRKRKWDGWLEFYTEGRFIAFGASGWSRIGGVAIDRDWTDHLRNVVPERAFLGPLPEGVDPAYTGPEDDNELLNIMLGSKSAANAFGEGVSMKQLWEADHAALTAQWPDYHGADTFDPSAADMALMSHLAFWTGKDMPRMDRLFRMSALMRDKYERREDYRKDTIQKAARLVSRVFDKPKPEPKGETRTGVATRHEVFLSIPEMKEHFAGCVYVRDLHRILIPDGTTLKPEQFNATYGGHLFTMMPDNSKPEKHAFTAFTQNACHRFPQVHSTVFRPKWEPGEIRGNKVNSYVKPDVDMRPGDVTRILDLMSLILPNDTDRAQVLNYMAAVVQYPGVKFRWSPVLQGVQGNGKTTLAMLVGYAIGEKYHYAPRASKLGGQFNKFLLNRVFISVDEIYMNNRRDVLEEMKTVITDKRIEVEGKGIDGEMFDNLGNWFFCTNHKDGVLKHRSDRRYAVYFTAHQTVENLARDGLDGSFFPDLYHWLEKDGYAFFAHYLMGFKIDPAMDPTGLSHRAPQTSSTNEAVALSLGPVEQEIIEAVESERKGFRGGWLNTHDIELLMRECRFKISRSRMSLILRDLGYQPAGRAHKPIMDCELRRPALWYKGDVNTVTPQDCAVAQAWR